MKKVLIASLVLGMVVVFSGAANAQSWWKSEQITTSVTLTVPIVSKGNTILYNTSGKFEGYLVANTTTAAQGFTIEEVFMCGTLTTKVETLDVWIDFPGTTGLGTNAFSFISTDTAKEPATGKTDKETADIIGIGTFHDQTNVKTGPSFLKGTMTLTENSSDNIESVTVKGTVVGGYVQGAVTAYPGQSYSPSVSAVLTPYTDQTPLTCIGGVVKPVT